jgi:hypothetical protein
VGAARIKDRFDIVQIEYRGFAAAAQLFDIRCAPGVFHDSEIIAAASDDAFDFPALPSQPVHQRRHAPQCACGIPDISGQKVPPMLRERDYILVLYETVWQKRRLSAVRQDDEIHLCKVSKVMQKGSDPKRPASVQWIRRLRGKHQGFHSMGFRFIK